MKSICRFAVADIARFSARRSAVADISCFARGYAILISNRNPERN